MFDSNKLDIISSLFCIWTLAKIFKGAESTFDTICWAVEDTGKGKCESRLKLCASLRNIAFTILKTASNENVWQSWPTRILSSIIRTFPIYRSKKSPALNPFSRKKNVFFQE